MATAAAVGPQQLQSQSATSRATASSSVDDPLRRNAPSPPGQQSRNGITEDGHDEGTVGRLGGGSSSRYSGSHLQHVAVEEAGAEEEEDIGLSSASKRQSGSGWLAHRSTDHLNHDDADGQYGDDSYGADHADETYRGKAFFSGHSAHYSKPSRSRAPNGRAISASSTASSLQSQEDEEDEEGEEGSDAKQVQLNLERWAAAERQRRKAARSSRNSFLGVPEGSGNSNSLTRRLSTFGRRTNNGPTNSSTSTIATDQSSLRQGTDDHSQKRWSTANSASSVDSWPSEGTRVSANGSIDSAPRRLNGSAYGSGDGMGSRGIDFATTMSPDAVDPAGTSPHKDRKGKGKATDDDEGQQDRSPFSDPSETFPSPRRRSYVKPSALRPIVTPGRAPSIRRTPAGTPSIVATDADAANGSMGTAARGSPENPFLSSNEAASANGGHYPLSAINEADGDEKSTITGNSTTDGGTPRTSSIRPSGIQRRETSETVQTARTPRKQGSNDSDAATTSPTTSMADKRLSRMSTSSKFREIGLDDDEDEDDYNSGGPDGARRSSGYDQEEADRRRRIKSRALQGEDDDDDIGYDGKRRSSSRYKDEYSPTSPTSPTSAKAYGRISRMLNPMSPSSGPTSSPARHPADSHAEQQRQKRLQRQKHDDEENARAEAEAEEDRRRIREGRGRQPWWTEWLCGCGRVFDEDNEQTGKTGPE